MARRSNSTEGASNTPPSESAQQAGKASHPTSFRAEARVYLPSDFHPPRVECSPLDPAAVEAMRARPKGVVILPGGKAVDVFLEEDKAEIERLVKLGGTLVRKG